ncbi:MAG: hypothetical protein ABSE51_06925 [Terracidiphilus sp.]|jgi:hypothetical protein
MTISSVLRKLPYLVAIAVLAFGTTAEASTGSVPVTGGTLSWTITTDGPYTCGMPSEPKSFTVYVDTLFYFTPTGGTAIAASPVNGAAYINSPGIDFACPNSGPQGTNPTVLDFPNVYVIDFSIQNLGAGTATVVSE